MRKNGSREISFAQYRTTDLFLFAVIVGLAELFAFAAKLWFPEQAVYTFSFMLPLTLMVMMRWGWPSVFYAAASGIINCALNGYGAQYYLILGAGNAATIVALAFLLPVGKARVAKNLGLSLLLVIIAWASQTLATAGLYAATGTLDFVSALTGLCSFSGLLSLVMAAIVIFIVRKFDGLFEDQKAYLVRIGKMSEERRRRDTFGDELAELDEENLSILNRDDDLYL